MNEKILRLLKIHWAAFLDLLFPELDDDERSEIDKYI